ncbi:MAG TPA: phage baseplate protein [Thermoanaerobaculia bacterium]|nr:phage baseplate protein [Thermoanaerobaculia bacterium]
MFPHPLTQADLLELWEQGEGARTVRRARVLLAAAQCEEAAEPMTVGRRDAALLDLRECLFGSRFTGITRCPQCDTEIELTFDAPEVRRPAPPPAETTFAIDAGGVTMECRLPAAADLETLDGMGDIAAARNALLTACIVRAERGGVAIDVASLPGEIGDAVAARMGELDPQADVAFDVSCPSCAHAWREPFDVLTFLWSEIAAHARRLLGDVHLLASAYGWSESDILGMSPQRRAVYIGMLP